MASRSQSCSVPTAYCLLPTAYCLFFPHRGFGVSPFALAAISFSLRPCMDDRA